MPNPSRRTTPRIGRGPVSIIAALILLAYGLLTGSIDLQQVLGQLLGTPAQPTAARPTPTRSSAAATRFESYILALSWSPEYCADEGSNDAVQCSPGKRLGFVLHGLWPSATGEDPAFCSNQDMTAAARSRYPGLFPTDALLSHEWEKHGTCSGLGPDQYLALAKRLRDSVSIPQAYAAPDRSFRATSAQVESAFTAANAGLPAASVAVICTEDGRYLREVYACFTPDGQPTACDRDVEREASRTCRAGEFQIRPTR